jgi:hypothetical protein
LPFGGLSFSATSRGRVLAKPPGGGGTTIVIERLGNSDCAGAADGATPIKIAAMMQAAFHQSSIFKICFLDCASRYRGQTLMDVKPFKSPQ